MMEQRRERPKLSLVREHFNKNIPAKQVQRKHCKAELTFHGSTTVMHEHLKRKHPEAVMSTPDGFSRTKQRRVDEFVLERLMHPSNG